MEKIIIGTRGSQLSVIQTTIVKDLLQSLLPNTHIEIVTITTSGDKNMSPIPLDTIGKGWFTKEIDKQLLSGKIDLAVHSLKDLLDTLTPGLAISAIPKREDASEALVSTKNISLQKLRKGAVVGTDSIRRKMQILYIRPDLMVKSVRGNVNKRLTKLDAGEYDALLLAVAGLNRLGLQHRIAQYFDPKDFIPSPGQGALAVVSRVDDTKLNTILAKLNHASTVVQVSAEREFSKSTGGGCSMPVGAYAKSEGPTLTLYGMLGSEDEKHMVKDMVRGNIKNPKALARQLAQKLSRRIAHTAKYIVLTRTTEANNLFAKALPDYRTLSCPSIGHKKNMSTQQLKKYFTDISSYDWIFFTSSSGVTFFMESLKAIGKNISHLKNVSIGVIGEKTAETARKYDLTISFLPKEFSSMYLVKEIPGVKGKKILLPRSNIADEELPNELIAKGALVTTMPIYKTEYAKTEMTEFKKRLLKDQILCLTFTSPSTVDGFLRNIAKNMLSSVLSLPVVSIGPVTTKAAKRNGFRMIHTAPVHTTDGIRTLLQSDTLY